MAINNQDRLVGEVQRVNSLLEHTQKLLPSFNSRSFCRHEYRLLKDIANRTIHGDGLDSPRVQLAREWIVFVNPRLHDGILVPRPKARLISKYHRLVLF